MPLVFLQAKKITELQPDGSVIMSIKTRNAIYLRGWILGWGINVEVLEPEVFRNQISHIIDTLQDIYTKKKE
jgi:predicted DNA-binding transcriptional regulator YafY